MRAHRVMAASFALVAGVALAGCGGDEGGGGGDTSVDEWAGGVCTAVGTWVTDVQARAADFQSAVSDVTDPAAAKAQLATFADEVIAQTDTMLSGVEAAGEPDVDDGQQLAADLNTGLAAVKPVFEELKTGVAALPTDSPEAFTAAADQLTTTLNQGMETFGTSFDAVSSKYQSDELEQAFADNEACKAISGST